MMPLLNRLRLLDCPSVSKFPELLPPHRAIIATRPTDVRFRTDYSHLAMFAPPIKPPQPQGQSSPIPSTPLLLTSTIRTPASLSGFLNPNRPWRASFSLSEETTSTSILTFHCDCGTQYSCHRLSR